MGEKVALQQVVRLAEFLSDGSHHLFGSTVEVGGDGGWNDGCRGLKALVVRHLWESKVFRRNRWDHRELVGMDTFGNTNGGDTDVGNGTKRIDCGGRA